MQNAKTFKLSTPIYLDGKETSEIPYNFDAMTARDKLSVTTEMIAAGFPETSAEELDPVYHLFLFIKAAEIASDKKVSAGDILRFSAKDSQKAGALARDFFYL